MALNHNYAALKRMQVLCEFTSKMVSEMQIAQYHTDISDDTQECLQEAHKWLGFVDQLVDRELDRLGKIDYEASLVTQSQKDQD